MNKTKAPIDTAQFEKMGFNKAQATSLAWAEIFEDKQAEVEQRYQGRVDGTIRIDCFCHDCKEGGQFVPDTTRLFIHNHKGHKTTTFRIK